MNSGKYPYSWEPTEEEYQMVLQHTRPLDLDSMDVDEPTATTSSTSTGSAPYEDLAQFEPAI
jgi:hypothetical protein